MAIDLGRLGVRLASLLPPETAHRMAQRALAAGLLPADPGPDDPVLATRVLGIDFPSPIGIAPGFDKNAEVAGAILSQGAGFVEVGGVTPLPQPGNPRPRLFRLSEDEAVINRLGLNNEGMVAVAARLAAFRRDDPRRGGIVGVNLARNKDSADAATDYALGARAFAALADFLVVNVSSPNTPGLRSLQGPDELAALLHAADTALAEGRRPPLLVKVAPDLSGEDKADIAGVALELRRADGTRIVDGLVVGNTTVTRPAGLASRCRGEAGGLSGRPLFALSTAVLADFHRLTGGAVPLVGVGGVASGADAYAKIRAGASLVELYTALVFHGPGLVRRIKAELAALLKADGFVRVADAVGVGPR